MTTAKPTHHNQTDKPEPSSGVFLYLASVGFVGLTIIIFVGIVSVTLLYSAGVQTPPRLPTQAAATDDTGLPDATEVQLPPKTLSHIGKARVPKGASPSGTAPTPPISGEQRDQMFHDFESYRGKIAK